MRLTFGEWRLQVRSGANFKEKVADREIKFAPSVTNTSFLVDRLAAGDRVKKA